MRLDGISNPKIEDNPFDNLVLDQETKRTIEALVWNYALTDTKVQSWSTDFVKNKGEGRIFLLHGSPGVGKTYATSFLGYLYVSVLDGDSDSAD